MNERQPNMNSTGNYIFEERLQSRRTVILFLSLTMIFLFLGFWRERLAGLDAIAGIALFLAFFFLFYVANFRWLEIAIDEQSVRLRFGVISWVEKMENIDTCEVDELPWLWRNGGAGVHFMMVEGRYRVSFNFLEHERVVLRLKRKRGMVRDVSFSTGNADEVVGIVNRTRSG